MVWDRNIHEYAIIQNQTMYIHFANIKHISIDKK
jgi:hypothetical protein